VPEVTAAILEFLRRIGIEVRESPVEPPTFVPGIIIDRGILLFDRERMTHPGDLLHEAGHIAFTRPSERAALSGPATADPGAELAAIAWSYAAVVELGLDPAVVFHDGGYRGASGAIIENFGAGRFVGVPMLEYAGMAAEKTPRKNPAVAFPKMLKWLRDGV